MDGLRLDINSDAVSGAGLTVNQLIAHYKEVELGPGSNKSARTREVYVHHLDKVIALRWGTGRISDVKPVSVEKWLGEFPVAPGTRAKTKGVMNVLFQHAMRFEWISHNPIRLVRQSAKPERIPVVLEPIEVQALLSELQDPFRTLVLLACVTGLRRGELFGLKWADIDFGAGEIRVVRSLVDQVEGLPKTLASCRPIPMSADLVEALRGWHKDSLYSGASDWVFASPLALGQKPYWPDAVLKRHVLPAAKRAGVTKPLGWHCFRRTLATLLQSTGATMKTTQELLRHANPTITMGIYAQAVTADKREAQNTIAAMFGGNSNRSHGGVGLV